MNSFSTNYEPRVRPLRIELQNDIVISALLAKDAPAVLVECFLIEWFARTPYLNQPGARWSRKAAASCDKLGLARAADAFREHASLEEGRDPLSIVDARRLAAIVNKRRGAEIEVDALLAARPSVAMRAFRLLNEEVLSAEVPLGYAAIMHEIERATSTLCLALILQAQRALGDDVVERLTWLRRRAPLGVSRVGWSERAIDEILEHRPDAAAQLAEIGAGALDIYRHFLRECADAANARARAILAETPSQKPRSSRPELHA